MKMLRIRFSWYHYCKVDILVGSGITLSPDGDIFFTGIMTGNGSGLLVLQTQMLYLQIR